MNSNDAWLKLKTPALEVNELAKWWCVPSRLVVPHLESIDGAVQIGRRWRVPLAEMPVEYLHYAGHVVINSVKPSETLQQSRNVLPASSDLT